MHKLKTSKPVGIVNVEHFQNNFSLRHCYPSAYLKDFIEHYWFLSWQLAEDESHQQSVIPHPCTHLTFLKNNSHIQGVCEQKYNHTLQGQGNIIGVKFKPAGFYPFAHNAGLALNDVTNKVIDIKSVFNIDVGKAEQEILKLDVMQNKADYIETLLFPEQYSNIYFNAVNQDENISKLNAMVEDIVKDKSIMKVSDLCQKYAIEQRKLQRLFTKYIGVSVKWVINRYRMHDALSRVETEQDIDWSNLAIKLGYYDQAHFIKDFKKIVGETPKKYHQSLTR